MRNFNWLERLTIPQQLFCCKFVKFCLVGLSGVLVDMSALFVLNDSRFFGFGVIMSKFIAVELAIVNNFAWNDRWTFRSAAGRPHSIMSRFFKFNLICSAGLVLSLSLLYILNRRLGINVYVANLVAIVFTTIVNFWLNLKLNWKSKVTI
jgi:dolichol-phosphate mannosyltransferase